MSARFVLWSTLVGALVMAASAGLMLPLVFGPAFRGSVAPLLWLLPGVTFFSLTMVLAGHIGGIGKPYLNLIVATFSLIVVVPATLLLVPRFGIAGAAVANGTSYAVSAIATVAIFCSIEKQPLKHVLLPCSGDRERLLQIAANMSEAISRQR